MRSAFCFPIAVLSDMLGHLALRASAQIVRRQWPKARILVLGKVPAQFDDHLYDEAVPHTSNEGTLLAVIEKLSANFKDQETSTMADWLAYAIMPTGLSKSRVPEKSDPRKHPDRWADFSPEGTGKQWSHPVDPCTKRRFFC